MASVASETLTGVTQSKIGDVSLFIYWRASEASETVLGVDNAKSGICYMYVCMDGTILFNRLHANDANMRQLRKIDNRGGRKYASKMRLRVHFALQLCGVKDATDHNCRRFYIDVSIF